LTKERSAIVDQRLLFLSFLEALGALLLPVRSFIAQGHRRALSPINVWTSLICPVSPPSEQPNGNGEKQQFPSGRISSVTSSQKRIPPFVLLAKTTY
jgi:hypothetical protein